MKKKLILFFFLIYICLCLVGCANKNDTIEIYNKSSLVHDNITIETKNGYFYNNHEKFTIDDNTIGVTIYFSTIKDGGWDTKSKN